MKHKVSVIMGIYNCSNTLSEAIDSILSQSFSDWEIVLCDDGSGDDTYEIASKYRENYPNCIKLIRNPQNMGLNYTLNHCLKYAEGEYIARMDGDDISLPERFEREVSFLENHPEYAIVSTPMIYFDDNGDWGYGVGKGEVKNEDFISGTPFCHAPCMVRRSAYDAVNGYSTDRRTLRAEDYDLWFRMYHKGYKGYNLPEPLYKMRDDKNAYNRRKFKYAINEAYVKWNGYRLLRIPIIKRFYILRPIIVALLPRPIYHALHHRKKRGN